MWSSHIKELGDLGWKRSEHIWKIIETLGSYALAKNNLKLSENLMLFEAKEVITSENRTYFERKLNKLF